MNYIAQITKLFGVKTNERFKIIDIHTNDYSEYEYMFTNDSLRYVHPKENDKRSKEVPSKILAGIITGKMQIVKKPWKPKLNEEYYYPCISNAHPDACLGLWLNAKSDNNLYKSNFICRTKEEAKIKAEIMIKSVKNINTYFQQTEKEG